MARTTSIAGTNTGQANVYQNSVSRAGADRIADTPRGVVAIVGPCEGDIEPYKPLLFRSPSKLKELLGSGNLYDAARFAFEPSNDDKRDVKGASSVLVVRANNAQQGTILIQNSDDETLHTLLSKAWGIKASRVTLKREGGTLGGLGQKLTISYPGKNDEIGDNLGFLPAFIIRYVGGATPATACALTVSPTALTTAVTPDGGGPADEALNLTFAQYPTVDRLVAAINAFRGAEGAQVYEAVIVTKKPSTFRCEDLDKVASTEILTESVTGAITLASATATTFTGTYTGLDNGDVMLIGSEYLFVTDATAKTVVRGYLDSVPAIHSTADADSFVPVGQTNQAIYEWVNSASALLTDTRASANPGQPAKLDAPSGITFTAVTSGAVGLFKTVAADEWEGDATITAAQWLQAYNSLKDQPYNFLVDLSETASVRTGTFKSHIDYRWGKGGREINGFASVPAGQTKAEVRAARRALNHKYSALYFQEVQRDNDQGTPTWYGPWAQAAIKAGTLAGMRFGTPATYKTLNVGDFRQDASLDVSDDDIREELIEEGINFCYLWDDAIRWARGLSSYTDTDNDEDILQHVQVSLAYTLLDVRRYVKANHFARSHQDSSASAIKTSIRTRLEQLRDAEDAPIIAGSQRINGTIQPIPAFSGVAVDVDGNVARGKYNIVPTGGVEFIPIDTVVGEYRSAA